LFRSVVDKGIGPYVVHRRNGRAQPGRDGRRDRYTLVVTYGAANALGIQVEPVWDEIQRSNLSKVWPDGAIHKREDGKVIKPSTYSPAAIDGVLAQQVDQYLQNLPSKAAA